MNRAQDEKCLWTWIWTNGETVPEEPEPESEPKPVEPEIPTKPRRTSRLANNVPKKFVAQDFGRNNLTSKQSGNLW